MEKEEYKIIREIIREELHQFWKEYLRDPEILLWEARQRQDEEHASHQSSLYSSGHGDVAGGD